MKLRRRTRFPWKNVEANGGHPSASVACIGRIDGGGHLLTRARNNVVDVSDFQTWPMRRDELLVADNCSIAGGYCYAVSHMPEPNGGDRKDNSEDSDKNRRNSNDDLVVVIMANDIAEPAKQPYQ